METDMNTGMLWFDNDPKIDFSVKILRASEYYQKKIWTNSRCLFCTSQHES